MTADPSLPPPVLVDKDQNPRWSPSALEDVSEQFVEECFGPLGEKELRFWCDPSGPRLSFLLSRHRPMIGAVFCSVFAFLTFYRKLCFPAGEKRSQQNEIHGGRRSSFSSCLLWVECFSADCISNRTGRGRGGISPLSAFPSRGRLLMPLRSPNHLLYRVSSSNTDCDVCLVI